MKKLFKTICQVSAFLCWQKLKFSCFNSKIFFYYGKYIFIKSLEIGTFIRKEIFWQNDDEIIINDVMYFVVEKNQFVSSWILMNLYHVALKYITCTYLLNQNIFKTMILFLQQNSTKELNIN